MGSRLWRAAVAGGALAGAAVALGYVVSGCWPVPPRAAALLAPALLAAAISASRDRRFVRRVGYGMPAMPLLVMIALMALATCDRLAGAWTEMGLESMIYQAVGLASAGLGMVYGWRYRISGGYLLAAVGACWLTAFAAVGWSLPGVETSALSRHIAEAALALAAGGLAGWLVGYGLQARRSAAAASSRLRP